VSYNYAKLVGFFTIFLVIAVVGGTQSIIDGSYEYYHYLQDRFDDSVSFLFNFLAVSLEKETYYLYWR